MTDADADTVAGGRAKRIRAGPEPSRDLPALSPARLLDYLFARRAPAKGLTGVGGK
ncbi:hypothetical protein [Streptomyces aurantiacus]|uniref:hypothetical protein n=1 Tax=Streptomyces aurantiacus TaxID=47760 RepID=UPI000A7A2E8A|nr:hypothetical protein [Streptomyces aurantiacus]